MYEDLTQRETEILMYIKRALDAKGYPPTVREICGELNIKSTSTVHSSIEKLQYKGYLKKDPTKPRAIEIIDMDDNFLFAKKKTVDIPILGCVTAGAPILAYENIEDTCPLPVTFAQDKNLFILKVRGDSMINAGIMENDYVIIEKTQTANNGEIILALIEEESTIKTFYKEKQGYRLQPENDFMQPIYVDELIILGKVVGLYRKIYS